MMKSFTSAFQKFILAVFCLFIFNDSYSQLLVEFRGDDMGAPTLCGSGMIYEVLDQGCAPEDLASYVKFGCEMLDAVKSKNLPFGWYGVDGDANSWYYIGDPVMLWATKWDRPNIDCPGGGGGGPCPDGGQVGDTIYVATTGDDATATGSSTCPYASLSAAITASSAGKVIKLATGTYAITSQITLGSDNDHQITITGGSSTATQTILRGSGSTRLIYGNSSTHSGPTEAWTWKNLTVENFTRTGSGDGVAFNVRYADGWTFSNVVFRNNGSSYSNVDGGVMYLMNIGGTAASNYYWTFNDCTFDGNYIGGSGEDGGALRLYYAYVNFNRCIFTNNRSQDMGGAVFAHSKGIHNFNDCLFYKNWTYTDDGAGFAQHNDGNSSTVYCETNFINCTFTKNTAGAGTNYSSTYVSGGGKGGAIWNNDTYNKVYLYNTIAYDNDGYSTNAEDVHRGGGEVYFYNSCIGSTDAAGTGTAESTLETAAPYNNLAENTDPLFSNAGSDDYSLSFSSQVKDAGCSSCPNSVTPNSTDLAGNNRTGTYDMGSYEYQDCAASTPTITATETSGTINNDGTICNGTSVTLSSSGYSSYSWSSGGSSSSENVSPTSNTTYTLNVVDGSNCIASNTRVITVTEPPTATITNNSGTSELTCNVTSISLTGNGGNTFSWSGGDNTGWKTNTFTSAGTYTLTTTTTSTGCTDTESATLTSNTTVPTAGITNNTGTTVLTCTVTSISVTGTGGTSYKWSDGLGNSAGASITSTGTYTLTAYGANGCTDTETITVTSNTTAPTATITNNTGTSELTCATTSISLTAGGGNSYSWSNSLGSSANATVSSANTYTVTATGSNGCTDTENITITSNTTAPTAGVTNNTGTTVLTCNTTSISVTATGGSSYSWSNSINTAANTLNSATTYTVTATASNGCKDTETITLTSNTTAPTVTATASSSAVCDGNSVTLTGGGASSYSWDNSVTNGVAFTPASTKTYTVTGTGSNGCTNTASTTVTVNTNPSISGPSNQTVNYGDVITLDPTITGCSSGSSTVLTEDFENSGSIPSGWTQEYVTSTNSFDYDDGAGYQTPSSAHGGSYNAVLFATRGSVTKLVSPSMDLSTYTAATVTFWHAQKAWGSDQDELRVYYKTSSGGSWTMISGAEWTSEVSTWTQRTITLPNLSATYYIALEATSDYGHGEVIDDVTVSGTGVGCTYAWTGPSSYSASTEDVTVTNSATSSHAGTYTIVVTDDNGCTDNNSATVTVNCQTVSPSIGVTETSGSSNNDGTTCSGDAVTLASSCSGCGTISSYSWDNSGGSSSSASFSPTTSTTYKVTLTNNCGNSGTTTKDIVVNSNPTVSAGANQSVCDGNTVTLNGSGASSYSWDNSVTDGQSFTPASTKTYTVTGTDGNNCSNTSSTTVTVNTNPTPTISLTETSGSANDDGITCSGDAVTLDAGSYSSYNWDNSLGSSQTASPSPTSTTTYNVTVTDANGCTGSDDQAITVNSKPTVSGVDDQTVDIGDPLSFDITPGGCADNSVNNEDIGSGNFSNSMTSFTTTSGGFWSNVTGDDADMKGESNITSSSNTGPDEANTGDDYIYFETSSGHANSSGDIVYLQSNAISDDGIGITFYYHMYGSEIGVLELESYDGSSWTSRWSKSGQQHASGATAWTQASVDMSAYTVTKLRFKYTADGGYYGDAALDDIEITSAGCTYAWTGPNSYSASTADVTVTNNIAANQAGTYNITITNSNGCSVADNAVVSTSCPTPSVSISGTDNSGNTNDDGIVCSGDAVTMDAGSHTSYSWSSGETSQTISKTNGATYTVTITNDCGTTNTATYTVTENSNPTVIISGDGEYCAGTTIPTWNTTSSAAGSGTISSYLWHVSGTSFGTNSTFQPPIIGTYTLKITNSNNCDASATKSLSKDSNPTAGITNNTGTTTITCTNPSISVTATGGSSYGWSNSTNTAANTFSGAGTFTVTVTDGNGCIDTEDITVATDNSPPTATITNNSGVTELTCSQTSISLTAGGGSSYSWSGSLGSSAGATVTSPATYTVTATASNGCTDTESLTITQDITTPTAGITNNDGTTVLTCSQTSISLTATGGGTYSWSNSLGSSAGASITSAGTYIVTVTKSNGCTDTESITITSNTTSPTASITNNDGTTELTCTQTSVSVTATGGGTYSWDNSLGTNASQSLTSSGTYNVTVTGSNGCTDNTSITLTSNTTSPTAGITNNSGTIQLTCTQTSISLTATGGGTYVWSNSLGTSATVSITSPGTYSVKVTGSNGCTDQEDITITQDISTPTASITNNDGTTVLTCSQTAISVTATGGGTYSWDNSLGTNASQSLTSAGTYNVTVTASNGCTDNTSVTLTSNTTAPTATITNNSGTTELTCSQTSISLTGGGGSSYSWDNSLGSTAAATVSSPNTYTVTTTASNGCTDTESITITQDITNPTAGITNNDGTTELTCSQTAISVTATGGGTYSWDNSLGTNASQSLTGASTYNVTVTASNGCTDSESLTISQDISTPTAGITNNTGTSTLTCATTSISVSATGGGTYSWSNSLGTSANQTLSSAATYTVTVTKSNGCTDSESLTIGSNTTSPTATITNNTGTTELTCNTTSISLTGNGGNTFSWSGGSNTGWKTNTFTSAGTYTMTTTSSSNGCSASTNITLTQDISTPTASITNNDGTTVLTCSQTAVSVTATGGGTYSWDNSLGTSASQSLTSAGSYNVTVTKSNGCTDDASLTLTSNTSAPTAVITNNDGVTELTCSQTSISLTASGGSSYSWNNSLGSNASQSVTSPATYTVTTTGSNGCTDTESITISQDITTPTAGIANNTGTTELTCGTTSISLTATGGGTYSWNNSLGSNAAASVSSPNTYTVTVTASNGCTDTESLAITQDISTPTAGITNNTGSTELTCNTTSISVTATGGGTYLWDDNSTTAARTLSSAATYTVTVTKPNGCKDTESVTITQDITTPTATITNNTSTTELTCNTTTISLTAGGGSSYSWNNSLGTSANQSITTPNIYTVTATGSNGCTATASTTITQDISTPTAGITNNTSTTELTCNTTSISVTATGGGTYSWDNASTTAARTLTSTGTYTVTATGSNGCTDTESITISQDITNPTAGITNNTGSTELTCSQTSISLTATGGGTYLWSNSANTAATSPTSAGTYTVTVTKSNGCTDTESITLTQDAGVPTASITNNTGTSVLTCGTTSISVTASGGASYTWDNSLGSNASATISSAGTYTVTATAANGCTDTEVITITSNTTSPTATITNNDGTTELTCSQTSVSLTASGGSSYSWSNSGNTANTSPTSAGTYTVTVTGSNGCTDTESVTLTSNTTAPTAGITNNTGTTELTCNTTSISVTATGGGTYKWDDNSTSATRTLSSSGTYKLTVTASNGCTDTESVIITQDISTPTAGITNNDGVTELTCSQTTISLTATGGGTYLWSDNTTTAANTVSNAGTYTVTVTKSNGCTDTEAITITQDAGVPTAVITNNTGTSELTCGTTSISLTASGGATYVWSNSLGTSTNVSITSPGTYSVKTTAANGCTDIEEITITQDITNPTAGITNNTGSTELNCTITSISATATGGGTYAWSGGGTNASKTLSSAGSHTVTVTGSNGCTATSSITLTSNTTAPTAVITNNTGVTQLDCNTSSISLTASGGSTYTWDNSLGTSASVTINAAGTYTVTAKASNGCTDTESITITKNTTAPTAGITNNDGVTEITCSQTNISLTATGGGTYAWSNSTNSANTNPTTAGTYTVTVTATNGCTDDASVTLTSNTTNPIASITNNTGTTVLTCGTTSISVSATGGGTYSWDNSLGTSANQTLNSAGTYNVTVTASNGCTNNSSLTLTSNTTAPTAGITNNDGTTELTCSQTSVSLTATGGGTYSWSNSANTANTSPTSAGTYTVTVTASNGCTDDANVTLTSNTTAPTAGITNNTGSSVITCTTTSVSVTATGGGTYSWDNSLGSNASQTLSSAATYNVTVTASNGCTDDASLTITSNTTAPTVTANSTSSAICSGGSVTLTGGGANTYSWNNSVTDGQSFTPGSTTTYTVTGTNTTNGCTNTAQTTVTVNDNPTATPTASPTTVTNGGSSTLNAGASGGSGSYTYSWDNGSTLSSTTVATPTATPTNATTYSVTVTDANGCTGNGSVTVGVSSGTVTWVGGTSTDWNTASNWDIGGVPSASNDVIIPSGTANHCYTPTNGNVYAKDLTVKAGATLVVRNTTSSSTKLSVAGDLKLKGTLTQTGDADILMSGTAKTFTTGGVTTSGRFSLSGTYTLSGNLFATNIEIQNTGSLTVNASDVRTYNFTQTGTYTMTTGNLYIEGSTANFVNSSFVEGTGHVYIGNNSGTTYYSSGPTSVTVTSGISFNDLTLNTNNGVTITMGTGVSDYSVGGNINFLNPGTAGGEIITKDAILVGGNLNIQTSGYSLVTKLYDRIYRTVGTGTFTMGSSVDNSICIYYTSSVNEVISGFGSNLNYGGTTCLAASGTVVLTATDFDNLTLSEAATTVTLPNDINITGNLTIGAGELNGGSANINLTGNFNVVGGTFTKGTSTVKMIGSSAQTITTNGSPLHNLEITNTKASGASVTLGDNLTVSNTLKLEDGVLETTSNYTVFVDDSRVNAIVGDDGTTSTLDAQSFVWGKLKRSIMNGGASGNNTYIFPVGQQFNGATQPKYYRSDVIANNMVSTSNLTVGYTEGAHPAYTSEYAFQTQSLTTVVPSGSSNFTMQRILIEGYWTVTPNSQPTGGTYDIVFHHNTYDVMGSSGRIGIVKCDEGSNAITDWSVAGTLASDNSGYRTTQDGKIKATGITSFSDFGLGDGSSAALPIELLNFSAAMNDNKVTLTWTTATEINNDYFTVERTLDGISFEEVLEMPGGGNSFSPVTYIGEDANPLPGTSYYRLKQTDYDGQFEYSSMVELHNDYISDMKIYEIAVASNTKVVLNYQLNSEVRYDLYVYDIMGKVVKHDVIFAEEGLNEYTLNVKGFESGSYFITLQNQNEVYSEKFMIRH